MAKTFNVCAVLALMALSAVPAAAQINSGVITGIVTDPQKAAVPNAKVEVVENETHFSYSATTNESGEFTVPYLKAGTYTVSVTAAGFPVYKVTGVTVVAGNTVRADVPLQLSKVSSQIEVMATAEQLQADTTTVENAVSEKVIDSVANINQNPLYYASLLDGVVGRSEMSDSTSPQSFGIGYDGRRWLSALNVDGAAAFSSSIQLDGLSVTSGAWNEAAVLPNTDSLQEVRVVNSNFTAEFGRGMGAIKMATKSGTNQFHGSVYDRQRNEAFNANTFSNNANNIARARFRVNDIGGTVGGRVIKDKLFFFTSYELMRHKDTPQWLWTVPTAAERAGDFSQTMVSGTGGTPTPATIYDPNDATQTGATVWTRVPYPNAIIPNPSPQALKLMSIWPLPNRSAIDAFETQNFLTQGIRSFSRSSNNSRMDYHTGRHSVYASGGVSIGTINTPSPFGANSQWFGPATALSGFSGGGAAGPRQVSDDNPYMQLGDTVILSPTLVLDVRGGINRIHSNYLSYPPQPFTATDYSALGIPSSVQTAMPDFGAAPDIQSPGRYTSAAFTQYNSKHERQTNTTLNGTVTKISGKWSLKAGAEFRAYQGNYTDYQFAAAEYTGTSPGSFTVQNVTASGGSTNNNAISQQGFSGATILTGAGGWLIPPSPSVRPALTSKYLGLFTQNDWRATSRLTVNLGLRWELQPASTDRYNRSSVVNLGAPSPFTETGSPIGQYTGEVVFPGSNGLDRNIWRTTWNDFGPRLGAAYRLGNDTVIRGGYGIAFGPNNTGWFDGPYVYNMGAFTPGTQVLPYGTNPNGVIVGHFSDPVSSPLIPVSGANSASATQYGTSAVFFDYNNEHPARVHMWNIFVERQIGRTWFISAGYTGNYGTHLIQARVPVQNNQLVPASVLANCRATYIASNASNNPCTANVPNPLQPKTGGLLPFVGTLAQANIPMIDTYYPYLPLLGDSVERDQGISDFNALKVRFRHTFAHGTLIDANYTWSKSTDTGYTALQDTQGFSDNVGSGGGGFNGVLDLLNWNNNKRLSYSDVPHRVVVTAIYELPFGQGHKIASQNAVARMIAGGWRLAPVYTWQKGFPLSPTGANGNSLDGRPNRNPGEPLVLPSSYQKWYNGKTSVTLPDGRTYTPCANCYLMYNPDAFIGQTLTTANGTPQSDLYWTGNAAIDYTGLRGPGRNNLDLTLSRDFRLKERYVFSFMANVTNALNHTQFRTGSYNMGLGGIQVSNVPAQGLLAGEGQSAATYGSHNMNTFDPRQMVLELRVHF
ncbi:MAG TPA: TonB-dependent receptor [Candidatus Limnocylindrales bacterium]|nr:TonB-dependent receptor [Candidatus Limnocylindrales bacterium]